MTVDFHEAFEKLHDREPNIEVSFFGPGGEQAEPQWGPTVGKKPGSAEDFDNLLIAYARHLGFTGTDDAGRAWVLGQLKDYLVSDRSQRIKRYETLHEATWEIVERARATGTDPQTGFQWKSEVLVIREAGKAAANFVLVNPALIQERELKEAGRPEEVHNVAAPRAGAPSNTPAAEPKEISLTGETSAAEERRIIGENLRKLRKEAGLNQVEVAEAILIRHATLIDHEKGRTDMHPSTRKAYADYYTNRLGRVITVSDLLTPHPSGK